MNPDYLTAEEVADRLGLCLHTACDMIRDKEIPGVLRNKRPMRVSRSVFDAWVAGKVE